ncbi:hypothetical protein QU38_00760, partial [Staphylococcus aureus]
TEPGGAASRRGGRPRARRAVARGATAGWHRRRTGVSSRHVLPGHPAARRDVRDSVRPHQGAGEHGGHPQPGPGRPWRRPQPARAQVAEADAATHPASGSGDCRGGDHPVRHVGQGLTRRAARPFFPSTSIAR